MGVGWGGGVDNKNTKAYKTCSLYIDFNNEVTLNQKKRKVVPTIPTPSFIMGSDKTHPDHLVQKEHRTSLIMMIRSWSGMEYTEAASGI